MADTTATSVQKDGNNISNSGRCDENAELQDDKNEQNQRLLEVEGALTESLSQQTGDHSENEISTESNEIQKGSELNDTGVVEASSVDTGEHENKEQEKCSQLATQLVEESLEKLQVNNSEVEKTETSETEGQSTSQSTTASETPAGQPLTTDGAHDMTRQTEEQKEQDGNKEREKEESAAAAGDGGEVQKESNGHEDHGDFSTEECIHHTDIADKKEPKSSTDTGDSDKGKLASEDEEQIVDVEMVSESEDSSQPSDGVVNSSSNQSTSRAADSGNGQKEDDDRHGPRSTSETKGKSTSQSASETPAGQPSTRDSVNDMTRQTEEQEEQDGNKEKEKEESAAAGDGEEVQKESNGREDHGDFSTEECIHHTDITDKKEPKSSTDTGDSDKGKLASEDEDQIVDVEMVSESEDSSQPSDGVVSSSSNQSPSLAADSGNGQKEDDDHRGARSTSETEGKSTSQSASETPPAGQPLTTDSAHDMTRQTEEQKEQDGNKEKEKEESAAAAGDGEEVQKESNGHEDHGEFSTEECIHHTDIADKKEEPKSSTDTGDSDKGKLASEDEEQIVDVEMVSESEDSSQPSDGVVSRSSNQSTSLAAADSGNGQKEDDDNHGARSRDQKDFLGVKKGAGNVKPSEFLSPRMASIKRHWAERDTLVYRKGYPGKVDDPSLTQNLEFYQGKIKCEPNGDYIDDIHKLWWNNYQLLEVHHGYIQWLFPIREPGMNWMAHELQQHEAQAIMADENAMERFKKSYEMMLNFYGVQLVDSETGEVERAGNWKKRFDHLNYSMHNYLRITRILKCLGELGLEHYKAPFLRLMLYEAIMEGTLNRTLDSCCNYWLGTLRDDTQRQSVQEYANQLCLQKDFMEEEDSSFLCQPQD